MSAMSASPPVKPVGAPLMPLSLIAEHKVGPAPVQPTIPREKLTPPKPQLPQQQPPTANGMEAALPLIQQPQADLPPATPPAPVLHNSSSPTGPEQNAALPPQPQVVQEVTKTEGAVSSSTVENKTAQQGPGVSEENVMEGDGAEVEGETAEGEAGISPAQVQTTPPPASEAAAPASPPKPSSDIKVATLLQPRPPKRKPNKVVNEVKKEKDIEESDGGKDDGRKSKRVRLPTQPYQSPIPELNIIAKISKIDKQTPSKLSDEKLIVFYRNEFLAVRNAEGSFYICQAMQNIYKSSSRIRIRWLSQHDGDQLFTPDFYDVTDFDCILTNLNLERVEKNKFRLPEEESQRTQSILKRAIDVEKGVADNSTPTEEHPDGLDLSLYRNEEQLKRRKSKNKSPKKNSTKSMSRRSVKKSGEADDVEDSSSSVSSGKVKKRVSGRASSSRSGKKRKVGGKKPAKKTGVSSNGGGAGGVKKEVVKKEVAAKVGTKRKSSSSPTQTPEKRPRRAPPPETNSKTKSVVAGAGAKARERRARK